MNALQADQASLKQLRMELLLQPQNQVNWSQLSRVLTLKGNERGAQIAAELSASVDILFPDERINALAVDEYSDTDAEEVQSLKELVNLAADALQASGHPWLVISVAAGSITIASKKPSPRNARLFLPTGQSHVQTAEQLIYRDPATSLRLSCLSLDPIRLSDLQPRSLEEYEIDYAGLRCRLTEAVPLSKVPLRLQLEGWDGMRIRGWMGFEGGDIISRIPTAVLILDGVPHSVVKPSTLRLDVTEARPRPFARCKFRGPIALIRG